MNAENQSVVIACHCILLNPSPPKTVGAYLTPCPTWSGIVFIHISRQQSQIFNDGNNVQFNSIYNQYHNRTVLPNGLPNRCALTTTIKPPFTIHENAPGSLAMPERKRPIGSADPIYTHSRTKQHIPCWTAGQRSPSAMHVEWCVHLSACVCVCVRIGTRTYECPDVRTPVAAALAGRGL